MNEIGMTKKDVLKRIKKEEQYLERCKDKILDIKFDIKSTKSAIKMWKKYYKELEKKGAK